MSMLRGVARGLSRGLRSAGLPRAVLSVQVARGVPQCGASLAGARQALPALSTFSAPWQAPSRGFSASADDHTIDAQKLLHHADVIALREDLERDAYETPIISYADLVQKCRSQVSPTDAAAEELADSLCSAGVVLRFNDVVYLKPVEIAQGILDALPPATSREMEQKLAELEEMLGPMEETKREIDAAANRTVMLTLWTGLLMLGGQWLLFFRLTFWELSWDVMEPVSYFSGGVMVIAAYVYFMMTHRDMSYENFKERLEHKYQSKGYESKSFDIEHYNKVSQAYRRMEKYAKRVPK